MNRFMRFQLLFVVPFAISLLFANSGVAGPVLHGRVLSHDKNGNFAGMVPNASIEFTDGVAIRTTSSADGRYSVELPSAGRWRYTVRAEGYKTENFARGLEVAISAGSQVFHFDLEKLEQGEESSDPPQPVIPEREMGWVGGRAYEETNKGDVGIANAEIILRREGSGDVMRVLTQAAGERREDAGKYRVRLEAGPWYAAARADGYVPNSLVDRNPIVVPPNGEADRDFVLRREPLDTDTEQGIRGLVTLLRPETVSGPPPDVELSFVRIPRADTAVQQLISDWPIESRDGVSSKYEQRLATGVCSIVAKADGYRTVTKQAYVLPRSFTRCDLTLRPSSDVIKVDVVELNERKEYVPVKDATVTCVAVVAGKPTDDSLRKTTNDQGRVEWSQDTGEAGRYLLSANKGGFAQAQPREVELGPSEPGHFRIVLRPSDVVHRPTIMTVEVVELVPGTTLPDRPGRTIRPTEQPIPDASVIVQRSGQSLKEARRQSTDEVGQTAFEVVAEVLGIVASKEGYEPFSTKVDVKELPDSRLKIHLKKTSLEIKFAIRVVDAKSEVPLEGARLIVREVGTSASAAMTGITGPDGTVTLAGRPGAWEAGCTLKGYDAGAIKIPLVAGSANVHVIRLDRTSTPPPMAYSAYVRVTDASTKQPVEKAFVRLVVEGRALGAATDGKGLATIRDVSPGSHTVRVDKEGYYTAEQPLIATKSGLASRTFFDVALRPVTSPSDDPDPPSRQLVDLNGYVVFKDSTSRTGLRGVENATLIWQGSRTSRKTTSVSIGAFKVVDLPEGSYQVTISSPAGRGFRDSTQQVVVKAGMKPVYLYVDRETRPDPPPTPDPTAKQVPVMVQVLDGSTKTRLKASVGWTRNDKAMKGTMQPYADGHRARLEEGTYEIYAYNLPPGYTSKPEQRTVRASTRQPLLAITLYAQRQAPPPEQKIALSVQVLDASTKKPLQSSASVAWRRLDQPGQGTMARSGDSYRDTVVPGSYEVRASAPGYTIESRRTSVRQPASIVLYAQPQHGPGPQPEDSIRRATVAQQVTVTADGKGAPDVTVALKDQRGKILSRATTNQSGIAILRQSVEFRGKSPVTWNIVVDGGSRYTTGGESVQLYADKQPQPVIIKVQRR